VLGPYYVKLDAVSQEKWGELARQRVFFGHMSVGSNILDGLEEVISRRPGIRLNIRETADPGEFAVPVFAHYPVGRNKVPLSKIAAFREIMDRGIGRAADVAFFKFCYVDIDHETDIEALFESYVALIEGLQERYPDLTIVTFTVPLLSKPVGIKTRLRKLLGRLPWYEEENVKRNLFNDLLRARFQGTLFDLAAVESRFDDERRATFRYGGKDYELLRRDFTDDGGHLNPIGRQVVAIELLRFLTTVGSPERPL